MLCRVGFLTLKISHMTVSDVSDVSDARNSKIFRNCQHIISPMDLCKLLLNHYMAYRIEKVYTSLFIIA